MRKIGKRDEIGIYGLMAIGKQRKGAVKKADHIIVVDRALRGGIMTDRVTRRGAGMSGTKSTTGGIEENIGIQTAQSRVGADTVRGTAMMICDHGSEQKSTKRQMFCYFQDYNASSGSSSMLIGISCKYSLVF
jgi:hypothetical protein